jgi:hypothetical protein
VKDAKENGFQDPFVGSRVISAARDIRKGERDQSIFTGDFSDPTSNFGVVAGGMSA